MVARAHQDGCPTSQQADDHLREMAGRCTFCEAGASHLELHVYLLQPDFSVQLWRNYDSSHGDPRKFVADHSYVSAEERVLDTFFHITLFYICCKVGLPA